MENLQILPESEYKEVEGRNYINPNLPIDRTNRFIDNLRANQQANTAEIAQQTEALGTSVPSSEGGLMGAGSYFTSRYATPQRSSVAHNLRTAAQATALNEALANEQAMWKKRYQDAYRDYQKRQNAKLNTPTTQNPYANIPGDEPKYETTTPKGTGGASVSGVNGAYTVVDPSGNLHVVDMNTGDETSLTQGEKTIDRASAIQAVGGGAIRVLPNGNRVLVKPGYELTKENGKYYLVNQSNGNRTQVGE